jgi:hypothetical protein
MRTGDLRRGWGGGGQVAETVRFNFRKEAACCLEFYLYRIWAQASKDRARKIHNNRFKSLSCNIQLTSS